MNMHAYKKNLNFLIFVKKVAILVSPKSSYCQRCDYYVCNEVGLVAEALLRPSKRLNPFHLNVGTDIC